MFKWLARKPAPQPLLPAMSEAEIAFFRTVLKQSKNYLEFGCGGSTVLACQTVKNSVTSVDSSKEWIDHVRSACRKLRVTPALYHIDIGPIGEWGWPVDDTRREDWPRYYSSVWGKIDSGKIDLCLVDGRFRVASFLQALLHLSSNATLAMHDFRSRPEYHAILEFSDEVAGVEELSVFKRKADFQADRCLNSLEEYAFNGD